MKSIFAIGIFFILISTQCFASIDVNTNGLTEAQKAELALQVERMKNSPPTAEIVSEWTTMGKNVGTAIVAVAGELGVAVDKFMESTTGKITVSLIVYKVIGRDVIHYILGIGFFIVMLFLWLWVFIRVSKRSVTVEYPKGPTNIFRKIKTTQYQEVSGEFLVGMFLVLAAITAVSALIAFA